MKREKTRDLTRAGLLLAFGLLLPYVTSHAFGVPGNILLPMHLPVFLLGLICGPLYGALGGLLLPALSSLLTGMPPVYPMLPIMLGELFTYGLVSGLLYHKAKWHIYPSLLLAMIGGRAVYGLIYALLMTANNGTLKALSVSGAFLAGLPGIAVQLVLVPAVTEGLRRYDRRSAGKPAEKDADAKPAGISAAAEHLGCDAAVLTEACRRIEAGEADCVFVRGDAVEGIGTGRGVKPLIAAYEEHPEQLKGVFLVDKIMGKAAAMLAVLGGAERVYALTMSRAGQEYLEAHGIPCACGRCVDMISNRAQTGICPLEQSVMDTQDAHEGYLQLKETIRRLMSAS